MKWSWKLGQFAGIGVYVHATFFLILVWIAAANVARGADVPAVVSAVGFTLALFACVVLHEFGHALTAGRYGIVTRDITLLPIGGVARLERMPDDPKQELAVALAGPAVNVAIAAVLYAWLTATGGLTPVAEMNVASGPFLERLMVVNVFLAAFNLLPAFPMDGGRVLRALLATRMAYTRATQIAASIGQGMAFVFGFIGLYTNPFLIFIALFVWIGATQEASLVQMKAALSGIPVRRAMITNFETLSPRDPLSRAIELILAGTQTDFPVVDAGRLAGVLTRTDLLKAVAQDGRTAAVESVMQRKFESTDPAEMLDAAFLRLQTCECRTMPVLRHGELVGLLTAENLGEFLMFEAALNGTAGRTAAQV